MTVTYKACRVSFDEKRSNVNKKKQNTKCNMQNFLDLGITNLCQL